MGVMTEQGAPPARTRREPPRFRSVEVRRVERLSPRMLRVTFAGPDLDGLAVDEPAASVRLLLPSAGTSELLVPTWSGNEFLLPDGRRPTIRTFTPLRSDLDAGGLDLEIVVHGGGAASAWAEAAVPGTRAAVSGPGRGYTVDAEAPGYLLAGDESALPAIAQVLAALPGGRPAQVLVEIAHPDAGLPLPDRSETSLTWCDLPPGGSRGSALAAAVEEADLPDGTRVWAAGEAAAMQRIRRHLFEVRGVPRSQAVVRGYWKAGRSGE